MTATVTEPALFETCVPSQHVLRRAGITERQLNHWTTRGHVRPLEAHPGSGRVRLWPPGEVRVAALMGRMVAAGLALDVAATCARHVVDATPIESAVEVRVPLASGLDLVVRP